jgi:hypothetical protein
MDWRDLGLSGGGCKLLIGRFSCLMDTSLSGLYVVPVTGLIAGSRVGTGSVGKLYCLGLALVVDVFLSPTTCADIIVPLKHTSFRTQLI